MDNFLFCGACSAMYSLLSLFACLSQCSKCGTTTRLCDADFKGSLKAMAPDFSIQHLRTVLDLRSVALEVELARSQELEVEASIAESKNAYARFLTSLACTWTRPP